MPQTLSEIQCMIIVMFAWFQEFFGAAIGSLILHPCYEKGSMATKL
jgi:hypothetical protein